MKLYSVKNPKAADTTKHLLHFMRDRCVRRFPTPSLLLSAFERGQREVNYSDKNCVLIVIKFLDILRQS